MASELLIILSSGLLVFLGIIGTVLPFLPGPPLAFVGLLLYGLSSGFTKVSPTALIFFGILTALTLVIDFFAPGLGAKKFQASKYGFWGSVLGTFLGIVALGPIGIIIGPLAGAFLGELYAKKTATQAAHIAWGAFIGFLVGTILKLVVVFAMAGYFVFKLF